MDKLLSILYAGYPYNGMNMYTIVDSTQGISEDAFNALLNPPSWIRSDFPNSIGDTVFSYSDYPDNEANLAKLSNFVNEELTKYYLTGATTPSGHTSAEIRATPFYQAAVAMAYASWYNETPLEVYDKNHSDANAVTEAQAYEATQYAIWAVLGDYGIENNTLSSPSSCSRTLQPIRSCAPSPTRPTSPSPVTHSSSTTPSTGCGRRAHSRWARVRTTTACTRSRSPQASPHTRSTGPRSRRCPPARRSSSFRRAAPLRPT